MKFLTPNELKNLISSGEDIQILDIRGTGEFSYGHISGSENIPKTDISENINRISVTKPVILCCKYGEKNKVVASHLEAHYGLKNIFCLSGGLYDWKNEIDPEMPLF